ncbi:hypothetical protein DFJ77DRAFT_6519 [Powellomyces hirtus]|nr:hypothetical protein DFJ77DRAFT_6519 [Powellomyces hirtus]
MHGELGTGLNVCFDGDLIRRAEDWGHILLALRKNSQAQKIRILSEGLLAPLQTLSSSRNPSDKNKTTNPRKRPSARVVPVLLSNDRVTRYLASSIKGCLVINPALAELELAGVPLTLQALQLLAQGLSHAKSLQKLSLARCAIGDQGLFAISKPLKHLPSLTTLNFGGCLLTPTGASVLTDLLTSRAVRRQAAIWECTLRQPTATRRKGRRAAAHTRVADVVAATPAYRLGLPTPITRLTLCHNVLGDDGVHFLMEPLVEEIGLLALDLQYNDITTTGADIVHQVLHLNTELEIVDLRSNHVDAPVWSDIAACLAHNSRNKRTLNLDPSPNPNHTKGEAPLPTTTTTTTTPLQLQWLDKSHPLRNTYHNAQSRFAPKPRPRTQSVHMGLGTGPSHRVPLPRFPLKDRHAQRYQQAAIEDRPPFRPAGVASVNITTTNNNNNNNGNNTISPRKTTHTHKYKRTVRFTGLDHINHETPQRALPPDLQDQARTDLVRQNAMLRRRLKDLEQKVISNNHPHHHPQNNNNNNNNQVEADTLLPDDVRAAGSATIPTPPTTTTAADAANARHIECLVTLLESSLNGFHALLDRIEKRRGGAKLHPHHHHHHPRRHHTHHAPRRRETGSAPPTTTSPSPSPSPTPSADGRDGTADVKHRRRKGERRHHHHPPRTLDQRHSRVECPPPQPPPGPHHGDDPTAIQMAISPAPAAPAPATLAIATAVAARLPPPPPPDNASGDDDDDDDDDIVDPALRLTDLDPEHEHEHEHQPTTLHHQQNKQEQHRQSQEALFVDLMAEPPAVQAW